MLRLAVTGSRDYTNERNVREWIFEAVEAFRATVESSYDRRRVNWDTLEHVTLIHGNARGFDRIAGRIAEQCGMKVEALSADWDMLDRNAGTSRNWEMIIRFKPNFGLVGPGEYGTGHMLGAMRDSGLLFLDKSALPIV